MFRSTAWQKLKVPVTWVSISKDHCARVMSATVARALTSGVAEQTIDLAKFSDDFSDPSLHLRLIAHVDDAGVNRMAGRANQFGASH